MKTKKAKPFIKEQKSKGLSKNGIIRNHAAEIVQKICSCLEERYGTVFDKYSQGQSDSRYMTYIIFDVCRVLNSKVWPDQVDEVLLEKQLEAITNIQNRYSTLLPYSLKEQ